MQTILQLKEQEVGKEVPGLGRNSIHENMWEILV
jgi:hypothetical protein